MDDGSSEVTLGVTGSEGMLVLGGVETASVDGTGVSSTPAGSSTEVVGIGVVVGVTLVFVSSGSKLITSSPSWIVLRTSNGTP
jgi:hypothetical protein